MKILVWIDEGFVSLPTKENGSISIHTDEGIVKNYNISDEGDIVLTKGGKR